MLTRAVERLRRPEYTGENRCLPCTSVNLVITLVVASVVGAAGNRVGGATVGIVAGLGVFGVGAGAIYLRGYLVPYTPTITERYFPERVLRWFEKEPARSGIGAGGAATGGKTAGGTATGGTGAAAAGGGPEDETAAEFDVERFLLSAELVTECENRADLCLTDWFGDRWRDATAAYEEPEARTAAIAELLGVDESALSLVDYGEAMAVTVDRNRAGQWESEAAFVADLAAADVLDESVPEWDELGIEARGEVLHSLRLFLEWCPSCGESLAMRQETVESCCRSYEVAAVSCDDCGARLFETSLDDLDAA